MRNHASVNFVFYDNSQWQVVNYTTERRLDGDTFYDLVPASSPHETAIRVNAKDCTPFVPTGGFTPKDYNPSLPKDYNANFKGYEFGEKKTKPKEITDEQIDEAISKSIVYQQALKALEDSHELAKGGLREQVAYGLRKYPEPLQYKTWNFIESLDHALSENSDKQHYLTMMRINAEFMMHMKEVEEMLLDVFRHDNPAWKARDTAWKIQQKRLALETKYSTNLDLVNPID